MRRKKETVRKSVCFMDTYAFRSFAASNTPTVMQPCANAENKTSSRAFPTTSILSQKSTINRDRQRQSVLDTTEE